MKKTDHAWAAGILDGEGCITITLEKQHSYPIYILRIWVTQSGYEKPQMLLKLLDMYGGTIKGPHGPYEDRPHVLPRWEWYIAAKKAENFLRNVFPYMIQKKNQAEIALKYREEGVHSGGGWRKRDRADKFKRNKEFARQLSEAKRPKKPCE